MNAPKSYHKNRSGRNHNLSFIRYQTRDLEFPCERTKGVKDYSNPAYRLYWYERVSAMTTLTGYGSKVLVQIIRDQRQKGYCTRSVANLGLKCGCSPRTVARGLADMREQGLIEVHEKYRPGRRGRTVSHIYVKWEHEFWNGCPQRKVSATTTDDTRLDEDLTAILTEDSFQENSRELATAVSMTDQEPVAAVSTAEEKTQAEKVEEPEPAPEAVQRAVVGTLIDLGVPARIAISDAKRAPVEAFAVLAMVYRILNRGGIRNPAGLARAALRDPGRYLRSRPGAVPECVTQAGLERAGPLCLYCGKPPDEDGWSEGMHFRCDEKSRG